MEIKRANKAKNLDEKFLEFISYLGELSKTKLITLALVINVFFAFFISFLVDTFTSSSLADGTKPFNSIYQEILIAIILAPIFETFIFQHLAIKIFKIKLPLSCACLLSALLFSLLHDYNIYYQISMFLPGLSFALVYCAVGQNRDGIWATAVLHALFNLVACISQRIF